MSSCETVRDLLSVRNQCVDMLLDRGVSLADIPEAPPKSLLSRYLLLSHEKGKSPLLDIPVPTNPILFLFEKDKVSYASVKERILYTLKYHSLNTNRKITVVYLGSKEVDPKLEERLQLVFASIQVFSWKQLLIPIQKHFLVPKHTIVLDVDAVLTKYRLLTPQQLPGIQVSDPMARHLFLKVGDVIHIDRNGTDAYRICINSL